MNMSLLYAEAGVNTASQNPITGFIPLILLFVIFYFFLIRPQKKKADQHKLMVANIQVGDKVITSGGIYGQVDSFKSDLQSTVYVKISDSTKVLLEKNSISQVINSDNK
ncbi:MAG: preprotein translocase subunit YajC [bacterium]|nr:preprotein translocase subunit YajC [bacterium]